MAKGPDDNDRKRQQGAAYDPTADTVPYTGVSAPQRRAGRSPLEVVKMADVQPESTEWLWEGRIPRGCLTVLDGDPGLGKSTLVCELAACLTRQRPLPGQPQPVRADVLIVNAEDSIGATIRTRLIAAGADMDHVWAVPRPDLELPDDLPEIERIACSCSVGLIVLDPLMAYLSERTNSFKDQHVRRTLAPLHHMAERLGVAVLVVRHLNKATGGPALYRGGGSIGIIGAARSGLLLARDPDDPDQRILTTTKSNLARKPRAVRFRLISAEQAARIEWIGECDYEADHLLGPPESEESRSAIDDAVEFLRQELADGPLLQSEVAERAGKVDIKPRTLNRAKKRIGVHCWKENGKGGRWHWELLRPPAGQPAADPGHVGNLGNLGTLADASSLSGQEPR